MLLAEKVERSGLDLSGRTRPTLAMLPRGNWIRHYYYDFPALLAGGVDQLVDYGVSQFSRGVISAAPCVPHAFAVDRFMLAAHSGSGMPAIDIIAEASRRPDEVYIFDGLYGRDPASGDPLRGLEVIEAWLGGRLRREPLREGAMRVIYIEQQTGPFSRKVGELIAAAFGRRRPCSRRQPVAPLPGRDLRGAAFANRAALHARAARRAGCAVQLAGIGMCLAVSMVRHQPRGDEEHGLLRTPPIQGPARQDG